MFLANYIPPREGPIINMVNNKQVGTHSGLWTYTIGENARIPGMHIKMYVAKKDHDTGVVWVVPGG